LTTDGKSPFDDVYSPEIMILGIGSILFSDDGFGIRVAQKIEKEYEFPDDVLVVDGFIDGSPAKNLCAQAFYDGAFAALREGGVMVANFMSDDKRLETYCARIEKSFGRRPALLLAEEEDNFIAFALRGGPPRIAWAELKARARAANALFGLPLGECLESLRRHNSHSSRYLEL